MVCSIEKNSRGEAMVLEQKLQNLNTEDLETFTQKYGNGNVGREA